jgi:hypothetical protein
LYQRKRDLYRVPPEVRFASRKIKTSGNKAKDTEPLATRVAGHMLQKLLSNDFNNMQTELWPTSKYFSLIQYFTIYQ